MKNSKTTAIQSFIHANPKATAKAIIEKFKVSAPYAYVQLKKGQRIAELALPSLAEFPVKTGWSKVDVEDSSGKFLFEHTFEKEASSLDVQVAGDHYKSMKIQPIEFITANKMGFLEGCIVKRISRWRSKDGLADLQKIKHEVDLLIELEGLK